MKKIIMIFSLVLILTGCSIVRIDTSSIDNILNVILTKDNKLYNQVGQGYKYYLPGGVSYIDSDDLNDILYCNGTYYYLYIDAISYYYDTDFEYKENNRAYYSKLISTKDGYKYSGYLEINEKDGLYYLVFVYNHAKIETIVDKDNLNNAVLNASYILSTIKYNSDIIELMLEDDYFTNKTGTYSDYEVKEDSGKFKLEKENTMEER
ncbi:MAG: membrane lipoprotein lipid attachment site-containing protein [Bacilli bacterium]|nr:membrane lipoprotein lipid attachment site-containing protein [Bacilli bacterium]